jgi:CTP synthase
MGAFGYRVGPMARYIFITGGVVSSLGKGIASAALGALAAGPWLPGPAAQTRPLSQRRSGHHEPDQHGEVFVTDDGAETDLDLGHYERFTGRSANQSDNITTGRSTRTSSPRSGAATISAPRSR